MKKYFLLIALISNLGALAKEPDSVYLFSYATAKNNHHNGLHFAWSRDNLSWYSIGNEFSYLKSDYGRWGSEKRMITPYLIQGAGGEWQCIWSLNERDKVFAHASSRDLVDWGRQSYPGTKTGMNILRPAMNYDSRSGIYTIMYTDSLGRHYMLTSKDFKTFSPVNDVPSSQYKNLSVTIDLPEGRVTGQLHFVAWEVVDKLIKTAELQQYKNMLYSESAKDDAQRFAGLKPIRATITLQPGKAKSISDKLMGIFFLRTSIMPLTVDCMPSSFRTGILNMNPLISNTVIRTGTQSIRGGWMEPIQNFPLTALHPFITITGTMRFWKLIRWGHRLLIQVLTGLQ